MNVVTGYSDKAFGPDDSITREQMATIMWRYAKYKNVDVTVDETVSLAGFTDASSINSYAVDAMRWAYKTGLVQGIGENMLSPLGSASRSQCATILMRFCENGK